MTPDILIKMVYSMINEEDYNDIETQPTKLRINRLTDLGKAFEDCVEILKIVEKEIK